MPRPAPAPASPLPRVPVRRILAALAEMYADMGTALHFTNPYELLVATMLSAQCTDRLVNMVTPGLFAAYPTAEAMAAASAADIEPLISRCGLYRNKAKNLAAAARMLQQRHGGRVPETLEELLALPGVGRKTANCVLANAFGQPALAVDTHVFRVANRLGLARAKTPDRVEEQLRRRSRRAEWSRLHHQLIWHGRLVCHARNPACPECRLRPLCPEGRNRTRPAAVQSRGGDGDARDGGGVGRGVAGADRRLRGRAAAGGGAERLG
jgi:endonuclease-3